MSIDPADYERHRPVLIDYAYTMGADAETAKDCAQSAFTALLLERSCDCVLAFLMAQVYKRLRGFDGLSTVGKLTMKGSAVLYLSYYMKATQEQIAHDLGMSQSSVSRILKAAKRDACRRVTIIDGRVS